MLESPRNKLARHRHVIRNPNNEAIVVWIEPWADRFELAKEQSIEVVFIGPEDGAAEELPYPGELVIYGWNGSEVFVLQDGRLVGRSATIEEIIRQEFEIAKDRVRLNANRLPFEEFEYVQFKLGFSPELSRQSQILACEVAAHLACELARSVERSDDAARLIWQISDRIVATRGVALAYPSLRSLSTALWTGGLADVTRLIIGNGLSVLPGRKYLGLPKPREASTKPRLSESESGPISQ